MENISNNVFYKTVGKYGYKGGAYRDYYNSMFNIKRTNRAEADKQFNIYCRIQHLENIKKYLYENHINKHSQS